MRAETTSRRSSLGLEAAWVLAGQMATFGGGGGEVSTAAYIPPPLSEALQKSGNAPLAQQVCQHISKSHYFDGEHLTEPKKLAQGGCQRHGSSCIIYNPRAIGVIRGIRSSEQRAQKTPFWAFASAEPHYIGGGGRFTLKERCTAWAVHKPTNQCNERNQGRADRN